MDSLIDLNAAASTFLKTGNAEGIQRCIEYSLSGKRLLQEMFELKKYECIVPMMPILLSEFYSNNPVATEIYVDLYERKLVSTVLPLPYANRRGILQRAVERKVAIDFSLCQNKHPIFDQGDQDYYYYRILECDCIELFTIYKREILKRGVKDVSQTTMLYFFPRILKSMSVNEESCKESLSIVLNCNVFIKRNKEHYEELLRHLCAQHDCRDVIYDHLFVKTDKYDLRFRDSLIKVAACLDERIAPKLAEVQPKMYEKLFAEDV